MITPGDWITFLHGWTTVVHASCDRIRDAVIRRTDRASTTLSTGDEVLPHGIADESVNSYAYVWQLYLDFAARRGYTQVPVKDAPWDMSLLWQFMKYRAGSCKPQTVISNISALAHFGWRCKRVLATSKNDGDPLMYKQTSAMRKQLKVNYR